MLAYEVPRAILEIFASIGLMALMFLGFYVWRRSLRPSVDKKIEDVIGDIDRTLDRLEGLESDSRGDDDYELSCLEHVEDKELESIERSIDDAIKAMRDALEKYELAHQDLVGKKAKDAYLLERDKQRHPERYHTGRR